MKLHVVDLYVYLKLGFECAQVGKEREDLSATKVILASEVCFNPNMVSLNLFLIL